MDIDAQGTRLAAGLNCLWDIASLYPSYASSLNYGINYNYLCCPWFPTKEAFPLRFGSRPVCFPEEWEIQPQDLLFFYPFWRQYTLIWPQKLGRDLLATSVRSAKHLRRWRCSFILCRSYFKTPQKGIELPLHILKLSDPTVLPGSYKIQCFFKTVTHINFNYFKGCYYFPHQWTPPQITIRGSNRDTWKKAAICRHCISVKNQNHSVLQGIEDGEI